MWALAVLRHTDWDAMEAVSTTVQTLLTTRSQRGPGAGAFTPQGLSMVVWSLSKLQAAADLPDLFAAVEAHVTAASSGAASTQLLARYDPQSLANLLWAYSAAPLCRPLLTAAVCNAAQTMMPRFGPISLATLAWSLAQQRALQTADACAEDLGGGGGGGGSGGAGAGAAAAGTGSAAAVAAAAEAIERIGAPLVARAAAVADRLNPQELGLVAWAVIRGGLDPCSSAGGAECLLTALLRAACGKSTELPWRSIAHIELVARCHDPPSTPSTAAASASSLSPVALEAASMDGDGSTSSKKRKRAAEKATAAASNKTNVLIAGDKLLDKALSARMKEISASMATECDERNSAPTQLFKQALSTGQ